SAADGKPIACRKIDCSEARSAIAAPLAGPTAVSYGSQCEIRGPNLTSFFPKSGHAVPVADIPFRYRDRVRGGATPGHRPSPDRRCGSAGRGGRPLRPASGRGRTAGGPAGQPGDGPRRGETG